MTYSAPLEQSNEAIYKFFFNSYGTCLWLYWQQMILGMLWNLRSFILWYLSVIKCNTNNIKKIVGLEFGEH